MTISVVTAVYNRADTIGASLQSLAAQDYANVEHVVQDGGSSDGTLDILRGWDSGPKISLQSAADGGIYDAINKGIARATGDVIGLLHSDDELAGRGVLSRVAQAFEVPTVMAVYGDLQYVAADGSGRVLRHWTSGEFSPQKLRRGWMPPHPTLYMRASVFADQGSYDTSYRIAADYEAMLRWFGRGGLRPAYIPEVLVRMRVGGESNRSVKQIITKSREDLRALRSTGTGGIGALAWKNISKLPQFFNKSSAGT
ncbi:MAG: glycosyltransferase [Rhodobacteraceae bacterium]|nr:glycosyltransferase [Paracoccaceae bacterium]PHQ71247.1 MAG: glycosyl transferase [Sneathiella sp.]